MICTSRRRVTGKRHLSGYKACRSCKMIIPDDAESCPNCGSTDFSNEWNGLIIVEDAEKSCMAKFLGLSKPGMYAINVT